MTNISRPSQDGLEWKETTFDLVPRWTRDPSISAIENVCRQQLSIPPESPCTITFHASGLFNKLYIVDRPTGPLIMRVSLPVYPHHKTRGEVATLRWVSKNTTAVPVPKVFGFDDTNNNEIGFEWILMELMQGTSAHTRWRTMTMEQKVALTKRIATFQAELAKAAKTEHTFMGIGTLCPREQQEGTLENAVAPGLLVSHEFFMGDHLHYDIPRGPFRSSHDWQRAELNIIMLHQTAVLQETDDEDDREDAEQILSVAQKLLSLVPKVFPPLSIDDEAEPTVLYHHDLHLNNILVNEAGEITAIIDWECVSAMPLWMSATVVPKFLDEPTREDEPQEGAYADRGPEEPTENEKNELYYIHRMEYEATQLRKVYEARLGELCPELQPLDNYHAEVDLWKAISQCDGIWVKKAGRWADSMAKGEVIRFDEA